MEFKEKTQEVVEFIQGWLTWLETTKDPLENTPAKTPERLQLEYELIGFSNRATKKLIEVVQKIIDKCRDFSKKVITTHNRCQALSKRMLDELPPHEEHLQQLHARFQEEEHGIQLIKKLDERVIKNVIPQAAVSNFLLEDQFWLLPARMADIRAQASKLEFTIRFLEPTEFEIIASNAKAWRKFIVELNGPT